MKKNFYMTIGIIALFTAALIIFLIIVSENESRYVSSVPTKSITTTTTAITTAVNEGEISAAIPSIPNNAKRLSVQSAGWQDGKPIGPFYFQPNNGHNRYEITDTSKIMIDGNGDIFIYDKDADVIIEKEEQKREQERQQYENNKNNVKPLFE